MVDTTHGRSKKAGKNRKRVVLGKLGAKEEELKDAGTQKSGERKRQLKSICGMRITMIPSRLN